MGKISYRCMHASMSAALLDDFHFEVLGACGGAIGADAASFPPLPSKWCYGHGCGLCRVFRRMSSSAMAGTGVFRHLLSLRIVCACVCVCGVFLLVCPFYVPCGNQVTRAWARCGFKSCPYEILLDKSTMDILSPTGYLCILGI